MNNLPVLQLVKLGSLLVSDSTGRFVNHLSAASGVAYAGGKTLYVVADDQASVAEFQLDLATLQAALRLGKDCDILSRGIAQRIIPDVMPADIHSRHAAKADFEALAIIKRRQIDDLPDSDVKRETQRRFPHGLLLITGSGGSRNGQRKRSAAVIYSLDEHGHIVGLPSRVSLADLHQYLEDEIVQGKLNIEGSCVHDQSLVFAQRGNSIDREGGPAASMLIRISLTEFLRSLYTDLMIGKCELQKVVRYPDIGHLPFTQFGQDYQVKLDFTDVDSVAYDPEGRLVFTAAAEALQPAIAGEIAGSVVGIIDRSGRITQMYQLADVIKIEGVDARYNPSTGRIDLLLVPDPDDPDVAATLYGALIG